MENKEVLNGITYILKRIGDLEEKLQKIEALLKADNKDLKSKKK